MEFPRDTDRNNTAKSTISLWNQFSYYKQPSLPVVSFLFNFLGRVFFFLSTYVAFIRLSRFRPWSHWIFAPVLSLFIFPISGHDRGSGCALGENCLLLMTGFRYTSRFCITIVPTIERREHVGESFKTVSTKFNILCQPIFNTAHAWMQSPAIPKRILCESAIFDVIKYGAACSFTFEPVINRVIFSTCVDI